jgi:hypothetical protein
MAKKQINRRTGTVYARDKDGSKLGWMNAVRFTAHETMKTLGLKPFDGHVCSNSVPGVALSMDLIFYRTKPSTSSKKGYPYPNKRPDLDNYAYAVTNALVNVVYDDDALVCDQNIKKRWATVEIPPGVVIKIEEL